MQIKYRSPVAVVILSIATFGIYAVYWTFKTRDEINSLGASIPTAWLVFIPIANLYFCYRYSEGFSLFVKKDNSAILWFLLFFLVSPVAVILVQIELNRFAALGAAAVPQASH